MILNICHCGSQDGYPHALECPYPYFGSTENEVTKWNLAREHKLFRLNNGIEVETVRLARAEGFWDLEDAKGNPVVLPAPLSDGKESQLTPCALDAAPREAQSDNNQGLRQ